MLESACEKNKAKVSIELVPLKGMKSYLSLGLEDEEIRVRRAYKLNCRRLDNILLLNSSTYLQMINLVWWPPKHQPIAALECVTLFLISIR